MQGAQIGPLQTVPPHSSLSSEKHKELVGGIIKLYETIDWALDITEAEFSDADFYFIPGEKIRRDRATQFLLHREVVENIDQTELPLYARIAVSRFESSPFDTLVAIAPKRSKNFRAILRDLEQLRGRGLAE